MLEPAHGADKRRRGNLLADRVVEHQRVLAAFGQEHQPVPARRLGSVLGQLPL